MSDPYNSSNVRIPPKEPAKTVSARVRHSRATTKPTDNGVGRYLVVWNWAALVAVTVQLLSKSPSFSSVLIALLPFSLALASKSFVQSPMFCVVVRVISVIYVVLFGVKLLKYASYFVTLNMAFMFFAFVVIPALNAMYLRPKTDSGE